MLGGCLEHNNDHYNCKISGDTLLDLESFKKETDENHEQFYERLLQHARLHMAPRGAEVGKLKAAKDEEMSVSLMNMIALQWLRKTDQRLIDIIRTEYSTELKKSIQLANLISTIAPKIDTLMSRYSNNSVQKVKVENQNSKPVEDAEDEAEIRFTRQKQTIGRRC